MKAVSLGNCFDSKLESHDIVGRYERIVEFKINLVLCMGNFVMGRFNLKAHCFKGKRNLTAYILALTDRFQIEIAALVVCRSCRFSIFIIVEKKKFKFGSYIKN